MPTPPVNYHGFRKGLTCFPQCFPEENEEYIVTATLKHVAQFGIVLSREQRTTKTKLSAP